MSEEIKIWKSGPWTHFMDMHSGGGTKQAPYQHIYIQAKENEARTIFYNRFGHNPSRVTCTCCGEDYSVSEHPDLYQGSGFERGCKHLATPRDPVTGLYKNDDPVISSKYYYEENEDAPCGYSFEDRYKFNEYQTLSQFVMREDVLIIPAKEIKESERQGDVPAQGYVWID